MTDLQLINRALSILGERPLTVLTGTDVPTVEAVRHYAAVVDEVLSSYRWRCCRMRSKLTLLTGGAVRTEWDYRYSLPLGDTSNYGRSVAETTYITCVADTAGSLSGKYFLISTPFTDYYVWIDVASGSTDPEVEDSDGNALTGVEVDISSGATNAQVATAVSTALVATGAFSASSADELLLMTNTFEGFVPDPDDGTSGFTIATSTAGKDGKLYELVATVDVANGTYQDDVFAPYRIEGKTLLSNAEDMEIVYNGRANEASLDQHVAALIEQLLAMKIAPKIAGGRTKKLDALGTYEARWKQMTQFDGRTHQAKRRPAKTWADFRHSVRWSDDTYGGPRPIRNA